MQKIEKNEEYYDEIHNKKAAEEREKRDKARRRLADEFHRSPNNVIEKFRGEIKQ
jgi:hypothetical protein